MIPDPFILDDLKICIQNKHLMNLSNKKRNENGVAQSEFEKRMNLMVSSRMCSLKTKHN